MMQNPSQSEIAINILKKYWQKNAEFMDSLTKQHSQ
jgi:hypothetical protein